MHFDAVLQVVKNYNFVTMDQLEQDKEVVDYCNKSLDYRRQLTGEEHEVGFLCCIFLHVIRNVNVSQ